MAKAPSVQFLSPVGRFVYGDLFEANTTDANGNPLAYQPGHPKFGQPKSEYIFNLAVDKRDPEFAVWYAAVDKLARESWPQFYNGPVGADGRPSCTNPNMSLKVMDGDGVDQNGKPNNLKEGYAGCWVIKMKSAFAPKVYYKDHYAENEQVKDPKLVVMGDFVRVGGSMSSNQNAQKPGVYVNHNQVALWGKGTAITTGPAAATVFGSVGAGFTPMGMQALPTLPAQGGGMPSMPGINQPVGMPMMSPAGATPAGMPLGGPLPGAMPMAQPGSTLPLGMPGSALPAGLPGLAATPAQQPVYVQPNPGILAGLGGALPAAGISMPSMPGMPGLPQVQPLQPVAPPLTPAGAATGYTLEQFHAAGYTNDVLRQHGYIA